MYQPMKKLGVLYVLTLSPSACTCFGASDAMTKAVEENCSPGSGKNSDYGSTKSGSEEDEAALSPRTPLHEERQLQPVCPAILHGEPLTDRKSTFQAHVAMVTTTQEV